jgi:carboxyl-terminal processing protease
MQRSYFWRTQLGAGTAASATLDAYFQSLLFKPTDRFSFTQPTASFEQTFTEGRRTGYGYTLTWNAAAQLLQVRSVEPLSPVARAGLARGDTILSIDGRSPAQVLVGDPGPVTSAGVLRIFDIQNVAGIRRTLQVSSEDFALTPVAGLNTFAVARSNGSTARVGYLAYHQFTSYSSTDMRNAFDTLRGSNIDELVLDLRYNGGGSVAVSRDFASYVGGAATGGKVFAQLRFNDLNQGSNATYSFNNLFASQQLPPLSRVVVIASGDTASASELVINGLKPFMPVVLVGETTFGKPYGFIPRSYCGTTYSAVSFDSVNSQGAGGFTAGFAPDCNVADDLTRGLGDTQERRLRVALNYIATGSCGALAAPGKDRAPSRSVGEGVAPGMFAN